MARFIQDPEKDLTEALLDFNLTQDYKLLFLLCIPLFWVALWIADLISYRIRT